MVKIYDLENCPLSFKNGAYGGAAGDKDGILIDGISWMVKYPKNLSGMTGGGLASYSTSPLSEFIGSHIYAILGYEVHDTILGIRNNKLVVACKDFATKGILLEVRTIKNHTGKELFALLDQTPMSSEDTHVVDLDVLMLHIRKNPVLSKIPNIEERFFEQALIDIFIANNDRNNGNWGILRQNGIPDRLAPVFDNGGCFLPKANEQKVESILTSSELQNNAVNVLTVYGKGEHHYSAKAFLKKTEQEPKMQEAIQRVVPLLQDKIDTILDFIDAIPESITICGEQTPVCSSNRKELYKKQLEIRLQELFLPAYKKILEQPKSAEQIYDQDVEYDE